jgi:signal transduction histidine kinase
MPQNPWLAIDAGTSPARRAREVRRDWEVFLGSGHMNGVRPPVADSWHRSVDAGVDPSGRRLAPAVADRDETAARWEAHPLGQAAPLIREYLASIAVESDHLIVVSDASGVLLQLEGNAGVRSRAADSMNFTEGALWSEEGAGTNAVGTALAADHAVQIFATEHFMEVVQAWTCSAAPVHDPETGELLGVIDLTGLEKDVHPHSLAVAMTAARAVEGHLLHRMWERDDRLRARFQSHLGGGGDRRALVALTGRLILDDSRGWLSGARLELPAGGGEITLPSGARAIAEPVGHREGFVVRELDGARAPVRSPGDALSILAAEQAALRRLATAAARNVPSPEILKAVAEEVAPLLGADDAVVSRFGTERRRPLDRSPAVAEVHRTGRSARVGDDVASPIFVDGRVWGAIVVSTKRRPLPRDAEERMENFTELVGTVIANAESRAELTASRARAVAAGDEARRRIQRDLHDGAQQSLVSTVVALKLARQALGDSKKPVGELLDEALVQAQRASAELRELSHGILPSALTHGGLRAGLDVLASRAPLPVSVEVSVERLPAPLEAAAYFIVAEALTNVVKHARAASAQIAAVLDGHVLRLEVRDDGIGGVTSNGGSGLIGLRDRAAALNGRLLIDSPPGEGTVVAATLPVSGEAASGAVQAAGTTPIAVAQKPPASRRREGAPA